MSAAHEVIGATAFDVNRIREDFPILREKVHGRPLVYLDNAATSQKPQVVIDALRRYYAAENANVHRGVHYLSQLATREYEEARVKVTRLINAADTHEIIYTRGTTDAINLQSKGIDGGLRVLGHGAQHSMRIRLESVG